jgi:hypothetical protein
MIQQSSGQVGMQCQNRHCPILVKKNWKKKKNRLAPIMNTRKQKIAEHNNSITAKITASKLASKVTAESTIP